MNKYDVTLTAHYEKTVSVYADTPEQAKKKIETVLFDTDIIQFTDEDFIGWDAAILVADEGKPDKDECSDEDDCSEYDDCSDCPYFCPVCGECMCEDECEEWYVLPSTEFGYPSGDGYQIRLSGGCPWNPSLRRKEEKGWVNF